MQTSYNVDPAIGVVGAIAEAGSKTIRARVAGATVRPGQYVVFDGQECAHPATAPTAATRGGVAVRMPYKQDDGVYAEGDMVDVLVQGAIFVASEDAAEADDPAFVRITAAGEEELGAFRTTVDGGDAVHVPGLYFRSAGTAVVVLEVNKSAYVAP